jgi:hypothetical protein
MKKIIIITSLVLSLGISFMTGCNPSRRGTDPTTGTDSLSTQNRNNNENMDSTMHTDTSQHQR